MKQGKPEPKRPAEKKVTEKKALRTKAEPFAMAGGVVEPGGRRTFELPIAGLSTGTSMGLPISVVHGTRRGPRMWVSAAIHGDELNGIEIIRRLLAKLDPTELRGTVIAVPIVNVFGFITQSRYLPDRRDLNRSFPGSARGSLAGRLASLFMSEIVQHADFGIDLHTGSNHRTNLPQIRADLEHEETLRLANAFAAPVMMHSRTRDGSLRAAAVSQGKPCLLFEGGEAQRFDNFSIRVGLRGVERVMHALGMLRGTPRPPRTPSVRAVSSTWLRAKRSGILTVDVELGARVEKGQRMGAIHEPLGDRVSLIKASADGLVIGMALNPPVNRGDAILHVASLE